MSEIGERLKILRNKIGLKQGEFAKRLEISQGLLSGIENGNESLSVRNIKLICLEFSVNEEWLLIGKGEMFLPMELTHEGKKLLEVFDKLEPEGQKQVQEYAEERLELQNFKKDQEKAWDEGEKGGN